MFIYYISEQLSALNRFILQAETLFHGFQSKSNYNLIVSTLYASVVGEHNSPISCSCGKTRTPKIIL